MKKIKVFALLLLMLGMLLFFSGMLMKIMHWQGQYYALISGVLFFLFGIGLFFRETKV